MVTRAVLAAWLALALCEVAESGTERDSDATLALAGRRASEALEGPNATGPETFVARLALGRLALTRGDYVAAEEYLRGALDAPRYWHDPDLVARAQARLAEARHRQGGVEDARRLLGEAREVVRDDPVADSTRGVVDGVIARLRLHTMWDARRRGVLVERLTDRELQLLQLLVGDLTQRDIGREMYLGFNTIKGYSKSLYRKLGVASRAEAVEQGRRLGLI